MKKNVFSVSDEGQNHVTLINRTDQMTRQFSFPPLGGANVMLETPKS